MSSNLGGFTPATGGVTSSGNVVYAQTSRTVKQFNTVASPGFGARGGARN